MAGWRGGIHRSVLCQRAELTPEELRALLMRMGHALRRLRRERGLALPRPVVDAAKPVISVIMIRDLGNLRLKPALVTLGSLCIFAALCLFLHERDKLSQRQRDPGVTVAGA